MNILKEVLRNEVYPALGCTEPVAVAFCSATAAKLLGARQIDALEVVLDPGTYKNGFGVPLPNTKNEKGNLIAAALGALAAKPGLKYNIFSNLKPEAIKAAKEFIRSGKVRMSIDYTRREIFIETRAKSGKNVSVCSISGGHFNITFMALNGKIIKTGGAEKKKDQSYKEFLKALKISDLLEIADSASKKELDYIEKGIKMNLKASKKGLKLKKAGFYIKDLIKSGYLKKDILSTAKMITSSATDARMAGLPNPVMSSGQSGNQGVIAILVPYLVGKYFRTPRERMLKSVALSHLINSYIKVFLGEVSPICGCAVSAGVGASAAIVYQRKGKDLEAINAAVNNLISDIGGMLCDGAKSGCALKVASSSDSSIRSAYMAIKGHGIGEDEGFIGRTAEETIRNLARITTTGMSGIDSIIIDTMINKQKTGY
ncbi:MAG: serine dehydratase subunit alpha family protein [Elusimicrobia bacterium CG08_land_8_20_14_0_20_51_18]|nr:MAG: serine dehydratase subunit alpha family protein [Elusimicrobia bacterium CG08_land_8_20_14_0_20_51_18]